MKLKGIGENFLREIEANKTPSAKFISSTARSVVREDREAYLMSPKTADELNTYVSFIPFWTFGNIYDAEGTAEMMPGGKHAREKIPPGKNIASSLGVRSIFNKYSAAAFGHHNDSAHKTADYGSDWRIRNNVPLLDTRENRNKMKKYARCTIKDLVEESESGLLGQATYSYSDFMYCKYLGKMSNNYLITLRRFPTPVDDFISRPGLESTLGDKNGDNKHPPVIGQMVTWMGTPGNDMSSILKYKVSMPFKSQQSQWNQINTDFGSDAKEKPLSGIAAMFDPTYRAQATAGYAPQTWIINKIIGDTGNPYSLSTFSSHRDANKTYGPVDTIKSTYMRDGDRGIEFEQSFSLTFDYELRAYAGINTRQAMLDLIANILLTTYITGEFWGGGYYGGGAHQNNLFTNLQCMKVKGGFNNFIDAFAQDFTTVTDSIRESWGIDTSNPAAFIRSMMANLKSALNNMGGMMLGGLLNRLGRPQKILTNSLLSDAPVGLWHITIGNPFHPIMSMGNMILKGATFEHYGPLGLDDFPTGLRITCEFDRGKPRDLRGIERLYMQGNDRIYTPMSGKVFDMYKNAKLYKDKSEKFGFTQEQSTRFEPTESLALPQGKSEEELATLMRDFASKPTGNSLKTPESTNIVMQDSQDLSTISQTDRGMTQATAKSKATENKASAKQIGADKIDSSNFTASSFQTYKSNVPHEVLKKYFGKNNADEIYGILVTSAEAEFGANHKSSENTPESDDRNKLKMENNN